MEAAIAVFVVIALAIDIYESLKRLLRSKPDRTLPTILALKRYYKKI